MWKHTSLDSEYEKRKFKTILEGEGEVQTSSYKVSQGDVMYSIGNIVNNIVITSYGNRW